MSRQRSKKPQQGQKVNYQKGAGRKPGDEPRNRKGSWENREARDDRRDYKRREEHAAKDMLSSLNDFSWYNRYPLLLEGAARLPFPYRPGMTIPFGTGTKNLRKYAIPGVMTLGWLPTIGFSNDATSPASTVAREIWAKVRSEFSSGLDVDPPDFVPYIMALDSIYSYIAMLTRIYSLLDWYSANNHVTPDGLLNAHGCSSALIQDMRENKADFNLGINYLIHQVRKFSAPFDMDIVKRHWWMNSNVYTDSASINSQFYLFVQAGFYKYALLGTGASGTGTAKATGAQMVESPVGSATTYTDLIEFGNSLLDAMNTSEDAYTMNGYLMRAYGLKPAMEIDEVPIVTNFEAAYQEEVLAQIENASAVDPTWVNIASFSSYIKGTNIWQDPATNVVYSTPYLDTTPEGISNRGFLIPVSDQNYPLSIRSDLPSVQDIVVASRLKTVLGLPQQGDGLTTGSYRIISGTEIVLGIFYVTASTLTSGRWLRKSYPTLASGATDVLNIATAGAFDWRPICMWNGSELGGSSGAVPFDAALISGDVHNLTGVSVAALNEIARVCVYSEMNAFSLE